MSEAALIERIAKRGSYQIFRVQACGAALKVEGLGHLVFRGWPSTMIALWILVQRAHPDWSPTQVAACLRADLGV